MYLSCFHDVHSMYVHLPMYTSVELAEGNAPYASEEAHVL